jgi:hypothetical protein
MACYRNRNPYLYVDKLLGAIEYKETRHPSWLHKNYFVTVEKVFYQNPANNKGEYPYYYFLRYFVFYENNTYDAMALEPFHVAALDDSLLKSVISNIQPRYADEANDIVCNNDTLLSIDEFNVCKGGVFFLLGDTIITSHLIQGGLSSNISKEIGLNYRRLVLDTTSRTINLKVLPDGYYWSPRLNKVNRPIKLEKFGPYKAYPAKIPPFNPYVPLNYWQPFRRWKAHLDSINAGLIPPDVYVNRPK